MASDDEKLEGRKAALSIMDRIQRNKPEKPEPVSFDSITDALTLLAKSQPDMSGPLDAIAETLATLKPDPVSLSPLVEALGRLELTNITEIDVSLIAEAITEKRITVDLSTVEKELKAIRVALERSTDVTAQLVAVAKKSKRVVYDDAGRITEISIK